MKINNLLKIIRKIHPEYLIVIVDYNKFRIYNEDAYIPNYLFKYDLHKLKYYQFIINKIENLNYLKYHLNKLNINYLILDKHDGYNVLFENTFNNNQYLTYLKKSKIYYKRMRIIKKIRKLKDFYKINLIKELVNSYGT